MTRYDILPKTQLAVLPELSPTRYAGFTLYGGTAIALQIGHRESIDFDSARASAVLPTPG